MTKKPEKIILIFELLILMAVIFGLVICYGSALLVFIHDGNWPIYTPKPCETFLFRANLELWEAMTDVVLNTMILSWFFVFPYALLRSLYCSYRYFTKKSTKINYIPIVLLVFSIFTTFDPFGARNWFMDNIDDQWGNPHLICN